MDGQTPAVIAARSLVEDIDEPDGSLFPTSSRRVWWVLGGLAVVVGMVTSIWLSYQGAYVRPTWSTQAWTIDSPSSATITFRMTQPATMAVDCRVEALDFDHRVVGSTLVKLDAGPRQERTLTATVKTAAPAVLGRVRWCHDAATTSDAE